MSIESLSKKWETLDNMGGICITVDGEKIITKPNDKGVIPSLKDPNRPIKKNNIQK